MRAAAIEPLSPVAGGIGAPGVLCLLIGDLVVGQQWQHAGLDVHRARRACGSAVLKSPWERRGGIVCDPILRFANRIVSPGVSCIRTRSYSFE
jgi:hypothetical protein